MIRAVIWCAAFFAAQAASQAASKCGTEEQCNKSCQDAWGEGYLSEKYDANAKVCKRCVNFKCMSRKETPYRDPLTGTMEGCPADTRFEFSEEVKKGECCENNKFLSVNATFNAVGCCPKGEPQHALFVNPCSGESSYCEATAIGFWDGVYHMPVPKPGPKVGPNPDPKPNPKETVKADGEIVLQDEIGPLNNKDEGPWFVCNGAHYRPCKDEKGVKCVTAKKWCTSDGCGTCLEADPQGIGRVCPGHNALGDTNNPRQCIPFQVEEVSCVERTLCLSHK